MKVRLLHFVVALLASAVSAVCQAGSVGQWTGSLRSWNHADMSVLRSTLQGAGHAIRPDAPISAASLAGASALVIGEPTAALGAVEAAALDAFVRQGGVLIVLGETSANLSLLNGVVGAFPGSPLSYSASPPANGPLVSGDVASDGPPFNLAGRLLAVSTGRAVGGGSELAGSYVRYFRYGSGTVYAFGDRLDHNALVGSGASVNAQLFLNVLAPTLAPPAPLPAAIPVLAPAALGALSLAVAALGSLGVGRRSRSRRARGEG